VDVRHAAVVDRCGCDPAARVTAYTLGALGQGRMILKVLADSTGSRSTWDAPHLPIPWVYGLTASAVGPWVKVAPGHAPTAGQGSTKWAKVASSSCPVHGCLLGCLHGPLFVSAGPDAERPGVNQIHSFIQ